MPILKGDPQLVASEVMDDVPEGGGGPTSRVIADGASNALFPDISESNRAAGAVHARKVHIWVKSAGTETFLGPNFIIAEPPNDPNVSVTLFSTGNVFDRRVDAIARMEAYLARGAAYQGFLYGDCVQGQAVITLIQRGAEVPAISSTLALVKRQGYANEFTQFVRVTAVRASLQTFTDGQGDFQRYVVELKLSDPLRQDFQGFAASRIDPTPDLLLQRTSVNNSAVADAAKYYGVTRTTVAAKMRDFSVKGQSIFSQLVPSAQIETIIADARTNQLSAGLQATGEVLTRSFVAVFSPAQALFIGGGVKPGTLHVVSGAVAVEDAGGRLLAGGDQVGTIDYENGILTLLVAVFGTAGVNLTVTFQPAQAVEAVTQSQGFPVTQSTRAISYVITIEPVPVDASLVISYRVAGQWYVLRDEGGGKIRGLDSGYGAGSLNLLTGTVAVTLGALPDVGSEIIIQWVEPGGAVDAEQLALANDGRLYWPINVDGLVTEEAGTRAIVPGQLAILWMDGATQRSATDDGQGRLIGDATGTVNYARGTMRVSPLILPPVGTSVTINTENNAVGTFTDRPVVNGAGTFGFTAIKPYSIDFYAAPSVTLRYDGFAFVDGPPATPRRIYDKAGKLYMIVEVEGYGFVPDIEIGTVDYANGAFQLYPEIPLSQGAPALLAFMRFNNFYYSTYLPLNDARSSA